MNERLSEVFLRFAGVSFAKKLLGALKDKGLILIPKEPILDAELLAIITDIMESENPEPKTPQVEAPKVEIVTTESKIEDAIAYCENNGIKLTVRNIAKYTDVSYSTVSRHLQKRT